MGPERNLVAQRGDDGITARGLEAGDMDFDGRAVVEIKSVSGFPLDQLRQHRDLRQQRFHVTKYHTRLSRVGSYYQHRATLTWAESAPIVKEAGEKHCAERQDEALASPPPTDEPSFSGGVYWWGVTACT